MRTRGDEDRASEGWTNGEWERHVRRGGLKKERERADLCWRLEARGRPSDLRSAAGVSVQTSAFRFSTSNRSKLSV